MSVSVVEGNALQQVTFFSQFDYRERITFARTFSLFICSYPADVYFMQIPEDHLSLITQLFMKSVSVAVQEKDLMRNMEFAIKLDEYQDNFLLQGYLFDQYCAAFARTDWIYKLVSMTNPVGKITRSQQMEVL